MDNYLVEDYVSLMKIWNDLLDEYGQVTLYDFKSIMLEDYLNYKDSIYGWTKPLRKENFKIRPDISKRYWLFELVLDEPELLE